MSGAVVPAGCSKPSRKQRIERLVSNMRIIVCLILSSCGYGYVIPPHPCDASDFVAGGVCVLTNGYDIDPEMVEFAVNITNTEANDKLGRNDDLPAILEDLSVSLEYVDRDDSKLTVDGKDVRGVVRGTEVMVNYITSEETRKCVEHYYVFSHEILHIVSRFVLEVSNKDNYDHNVEYVFLTWAQNNDLGYITTAEFGIYMGIRHKCEDMHGKIEW